MPSDRVVTALAASAAEPHTSVAARSGVLSHPWTTFVLIFVTCGVLAFLLQYRNGAYGSELAHYPDEAGHFVTSLMVRDFAVHGAREHPVAFAERYYLHYPKVAFGMWPPLFHLVTGTWLIVFPATIDSVLVWLSVIIAATALSLFVVAQPLLGNWTAGLLAFAYVVLPLSQRSSSMVMVDSFVTLLMLWVAVAFAKYLATEKLRDALLFGVIAGLAALTKGNGVAAVFIPPIAILVLRRWRLLLKPPLYCAAALVVIIAGPWQLMTARLLQNTVPFDQPGLAFTARMSAEYGRVLFHEAGPALLVLALIGLAMTLKSDFRRTADPLWTAFAAQLVAIWLFHSVVPVPGPEPRYMLAAMPAILLLAAAALRYLSELIPFTREPNRRLAFAGAAVALVLLGWTNLRIAERPDFGFRQVAATLHKDPNLADSVYMVASDAGGEGALIAEVAALDNPRPRHFVLRASKTLAEATWYNRNYQLLFPNPVKVTEFLDNTRTEVIVFDRSAPELPHSKLLMETIHSRPDQWKLASTVLKDRRLEVYRCERPPEKHREKLEIRMRYTLGRDIHE